MVRGKRPSLEGLEKRCLPAVVQGVALADRATDEAPVADDPPVDLALAAFAVVLGEEDNGEVFASPQQATVGGAQFFFAPPTLPASIQSEFARLRELQMKFPASGGGDESAQAHVDLAFFHPVDEETQPRDVSSERPEEGPPPRVDTEESQQASTSADEVEIAEAA